MPRPLAGALAAAAVAVLPVAGALAAAAVAVLPVEVSLYIKQYVNDRPVKA